MALPSRSPSLIVLLLLALFCATSSAIFCGKENCYHLLEVPRNASKLEIRRSYRRISSEKHPDKKPGDQNAAEHFRKISAAYEILLNDANRAQYDDFLDNPGKYWRFLMENASDVYAPKSNVIVVVTGIIGVFTLIQWLNMNYTYKHTLKRMKESRQFQHKVTRLLKSKQAASKEEAETMIDVVGLKEPHWKDLIAFRLIKLPQSAFKYISWNVNWIVSYNIRKLEYSESDKIYLIQKNMHITPEEWAAEPDKERQSMLEAQLWDADNREEYIRAKRIQLNRLGKGKKKKKHTPSPYSEVEPVNMSE
ncbi:DnaJ-like [Gracilariopsis chorda]|uniref:DnaJ-like n=1 Tax=Gracilariopsis chorda TaxID=448386 RepID=A0A2V3IRW9_9FLOR|nr:DnaJ-like [Gracilariopsis chorda]|eukprot:PXF44876.1 DnaJ-like [Gracilariopsis chorda]